MKRCSRCGETKPRSAFSPDRRKRDGLQPACRECCNAKARRVYAGDRERLAAEALARYHANAARYRPAMAARARRRRATDPEAERARERAYWRANPEKKAAKDRRYAQAHPEKRREIYKRWCAANPEAARDLARRTSSTRHARLLDAFVEDIDPLVVLERDDGLCGICGCDVDPHDFHIDHVVPLARGGEHSYANVQAAHPLCNQRKFIALDFELAAA